MRSIRHSVSNESASASHIIQPEDIPVLLSIGKENLYVWEKKPGILHEDEAAALLYKAAAGQNIHGTEPREGKIELIADCDGLLKIDRRALLAVNSTPQMMIATIHGDLPVKKGAKLAGTRIIPLVIEQEKMEAMQAAAGPKPILNVLPFHQKKFAVITTGSEVFKGRIEDKFTPILEQKLAFIAFMVVVLIASILVGVICKRLTAGVTVFCVGAVVLFILFRLRPAWLLTAFNAVLSALALFDPFQDIVGGMFSIPAIVYYLSVIGLFLFLTGQALERRRWN